MKKFNLDFTLKGKREYVHGTDLYKEIMKITNKLDFRDWNSFELNIRNITNHNKS